MTRLFRLHDCPGALVRVCELTPFPVADEIADAMASLWLAVYPEDILWTA